MSSPQFPRKAPVPTPAEIIQARQSAGLTQIEAAGLVHRTGRNWQRWEYGAKKMDAALWELFQLKIGRG